MIRQRGIFTVGEDQIARLLRLPPGQHVVGINPSWPQMAVLIMVEGDGLPDVEEGCEARRVYMHDSSWPRPVAGLRPAEQHAAVLQQLDQVRFEDPDALAGRRRILERHAPGLDVGANVILCDHPPHVDVFDAFPCPDYVDAAAGLVTGLEQVAHA